MKMKENAVHFLGNAIAHIHLTSKGLSALTTQDRKLATLSSFICPLVKSLSPVINLCCLFWETAEVPSCTS
jgi:hypothetical protein